MPFVPPVPAYVTRTVVIQITGPKDAALVKQLNKDLKKLARKYGAILKTTAKSRRRKAARAKRKRS
jgi:hypothetical protein